MDPLAQNFTILENKSYQLIQGDLSQNLAFSVLNSHGHKLYLSHLLMLSLLCSNCTTIIQYDNGLHPLFSNGTAYGWAISTYQLSVSE